VFDAEGAEISEVVEARKEKIEADGAWELLRGASEIVAAKGKKVVRFPADSPRQEILAQVLGRSGTLRAPTVRVGDRFVVGFNEELYPGALR